MTRRYAGGPPNGTCKNCPREAVSLGSDFCSLACKSEYREKQARAEALAEKDKEDTEE